MQHDKKVDFEVEAIKKRGHLASNKATQSAKKINKLLEANGITLKIHIATGGRHGK